MDYIVVKWLHILSSTILFGTGTGTAFFMFFTCLSRNLQATATVARLVVRADWLFTTPTVFIQPLTGFYLVHKAGYALDSTWLAWSIALFIVAGACWLPVVWLQIRMRALAAEAVAAGSDLPPLFWRYFKIWTALGVPAFIAIAVIFYLMVAKPV
ncbi:MAG TPA: DUF2269 domain-containing protein [Methylophilaceae bacterium]|nr:DUF2269 domain-containing protein [Methylophilaceae bacterium]